MFYVPNLPYAFYLAAKAKHSAFFSAVNPSIKSSGNGTESKYQTLQLVPEKFKPKSVLHTYNSNLEDTQISIHWIYLQLDIIKPSTEYLCFLRI